MGDPRFEWKHDGDLEYILGYLVMCARGWEPKVRLIGNARAEDIANSVEKLKAENARLRAALGEIAKATRRGGQS